MIFAGIEERRTEYPVAVRCRVLGASRAGFYARRNRVPSPAALRRDERAAQIREVHAEMTGRYGSPRRTVERNERGIAGCVHTVARVMKRQGLRAKTARRFVRTTDSNHRVPVAANVRDRNVSPARPDTTWGADITYLPTLAGWLFLALVVDVFSRRIVGWAMGAAMTRRLVVDASEMAGNRRPPGVGRVAHADRGSPYASDHDPSERSRLGMVCRMSGVGPCWDNAVVEGTVGSRKRELVHHESSATRDEARASVFEDIEVFYNRIRRHSTLGSVSPAEFARTHNPELR